MAVATSESDEFSALFDAIKREASTLVGMKRKVKGEATNESEVTVESKKQLRNLIVKLAKASRSVFSAEPEYAENSAPETKKLEATHTKLQALLYEKNYLYSRFKGLSKDESGEKNGDDAMQIDTEKVTSSVVNNSDLVDVEYFMNHAPDILVKESNPHKLLLNRLAYEASIREDLIKVLHAKQEEVVKVRSEIEILRNNSSQLPNLLSILRNDVLKVEAALQLNNSQLQATHEKCALLPQPLYILYLQLETYAVTFGNMEVKIITVEKSLEQKRLNTDQKRAHEAAVEAVISYSCPIDGPLNILALRFMYYPEEDVITAIVNDDDRFLINLFSDDDGLCMPRLCMNDGGNAVQVMTPNSFIGRPYLWAQQLAELYCLKLKADDKSFKSEKSFSTRIIMERITQRAANFTILRHDLESVSKCCRPLGQWTTQSAIDMDIKVAKAFQEHFPADINGVALFACEEITPEKMQTELNFLKELSARYKISDQNIGNIIFCEEKEYVATPPISWYKLIKLGFFLDATCRSANAPETVYALVSVSQDFPQTPSLITLYCSSGMADSKVKISGKNKRSSWRLNIFKDLEQELNSSGGVYKDFVATIEASNWVKNEQNVSNSKASFFTYQIKKLQVLLGLVFSSQQQTNLNNARPARGRDRELPLKFDPSTKSFIFR